MRSTTGKYITKHIAPLNEGESSMTTSFLLTTLVLLKITWICGLVSDYNEYQDSTNWKRCGDVGHSIWSWLQSNQWESQSEVTATSCHQMETRSSPMYRPMVRVRHPTQFTGDIVINDDNEFFEMIQPQLKEIRGHLINGVLVHGTVVFKDDKSKMVGNFDQNCLEGKVFIYTDNSNLMGIGMYQHGVPHGPFWILPWIPTSSPQYMFLHFFQGQLIPDKTVVFDVKSRFAMMGTLVNGSILDPAQLVEVDQVGLYRDIIPVIKLPLWDSEERNQRLKSPYKIFYDASNQRVLVRPSRLLYYNRIAKTGSISMTELLRKLGEKNGNLVHFKAMRYEIVMDSLAGQQQEVQKMIQTFQPTIFVRHYSFVKLQDFGYPDQLVDWFNVVRHPVEKVISYFYYRRAPWKLKLERNIFPDLPMPSEEFLGKNFSQCILQSDPECAFEPGEVIDEYGYHAIFQFCGHDDFCSRFGNIEAFKQAKYNVEKSYPVVGITENLTMTLTVAEFLLPDYFKGARKTYLADAKLMKPQNVNVEKPKIDESIRDILTRKFSLEIEFYEFCKQRLYAQYELIPKRFRQIIIP